MKYLVAFMERDRPCPAVFGLFDTIEEAETEAKKKAKAFTNYTYSVWRREVTFKAETSVNVTEARDLPEPAAPATAPKFITYDFGDKAVVYGEAVVCDKARVYGEAVVCKGVRT